jgi:hypothetical protein
MSNLTEIFETICDEDLKNDYVESFKSCNDYIQGKIIAKRNFSVSTTVSTYGDTGDSGTATSDATEENGGSSSSSGSTQTPTKLTLVTFSQSKANVAYGFLDLIRFIRTYKQIYDDSTEYIGIVGQFINAKKETATSDGKPLGEAYDILGVDGIKMYSKKAAIGYKIYKKALKLRDNSKYAGSKDCSDVYLNKIAQSLALQYVNYFNRIRWTLWTIQTFRNHYNKLAKGW